MAQALDKQVWKVQGIERPMTAFEVFQRLEAGAIDREALCRSKQEPERQTLGARFLILGPYGLLERLGSGAFGAVHRGFHIRRSRRGGPVFVALKTPSEAALDDLAAADEAGGSREDARRRARDRIGQAFSEEAVMTARLSASKYVVSVLDHSLSEPYLALEYCKGGSLEQRIRRPYTLQDAVRWGYQTAAALSLAHRLEPDPLVHRDLKPANLLLHEGQIKVSDFGLSKVLSAHRSMVTGGAAGTPNYMAPEAFADKLSRATDVWSLGVILYELVARRRPFRGKSIVALIRAIEKSPIAPIPEEAAPEPLRALILSCLSRDPKARPSSARCAEALRRLHKGRRRSSTGRPRSPASAPAKPPPEPKPEPRRSPLLLLLLLPLLALPAWLLLRGQEPDAPPKEAIKEAAAAPGLGPMSLSLDGLGEEMVIASRSLVLRGRTRPGSSIEAAGSQGRADDTGRFALPLTLAEGANNFEVTARSGEDRRRAEVRVVVDTTAPLIVVESPRAKAWARRRIEVRGQVQDNLALARLRINGALAPITSGRFTRIVELSEERPELLIEARDRAGNRAEQRIPLRVDATPPKLSIFNPRIRGPVLGINKRGLVYGRVEDPNLVELRANDRAVILREDGDFTLTVEVKRGALIRLGLLARDAAGNAAEASVLLKLLPPLKLLEFSPPPAWTSQASQRITGRLNRSAGRAYLGEQARVLDSAGRFELELALKDGANPLDLRFTSPDGSRIERKLTIHLDTESPALSLDGLAEDGSLSLDSARRVCGRLIEANLARASLNGEPFTPDKDGRFAIPIEPFLEPSKALVFEVEDKAGNRLTRGITVKNRPGASPENPALITMLTRLSDWEAASRDEQMKAARFVGQRLGSAFRFVRLRQYSCADKKMRIASFAHKASDIELNLIPGGAFTMGDDGLKYSQPARKVLIRRPFLIGRYEISQGEWRRFDEPIKQAYKGDDLPMGGVSYEAIKAWLAKAGDGLRLPSEAEWEYAARAGTNTRFFWGEAYDKRYCATKSSRKGGRPVPRQGRLPNAFGLFDTLGNHYEWCEDFYLPHLKDGPVDHRPRAGKSRDRVVRGGSINHPPKTSRSATRGGQPPTQTYADFGFRVARSID